MIFVELWRTILSNQWNHWYTLKKTILNRGLKNHLRSSTTIYFIQVISKLLKILLFPANKRFFLVPITSSFVKNFPLLVAFMFFTFLFVHLFFEFVQINFVDVCKNYVHCFAIHAYEHHLYPSSVETNDNYLLRRNPFIYVSPHV